jgi:hypothetical protein
MVGLVQSVAAKLTGRRSAAACIDGRCAMRSERHATPLGAGRTAVVELTLASSERFGFAIARRASRSS